MEPKELADWLEKGLGRAVLALLEGDNTRFRDTIVHACRQDQRFDHQCEDSRGLYLYDVIQASGESDFYRGTVLAALADPAEDDDQDQLFEIARFFAQAGDAGARSAVYAAFERNALKGDPTGGEELVALDGIEGFLFAIGHLVGIEDTNDEWLPGWWLGKIEEQMGKEAAWVALDEAATTDARLNAILEHERDEERKREEKRLVLNKRTRLADAPHTEMRTHIQSSGSKTSRATLPRWGERASADDLLAAAADLLAEQDNGRLLSYLRLFWRRPFPLDPGRLIALSDVADIDAAWDAMRALEPIRHPEVRTRAIALLSHPLFAPEAIRMLSSNFESGDEVLVERALAVTRDNKDVSHRLGIKARSFADAHPTISTRFLDLLYENTPCSMCRESAVGLMVETDRLPVRIREECRWDSSAETRRLAATAD